MPQKLSSKHQVILLLRRPPIQLSITTFALQTIVQHLCIPHCTDLVFNIAEDYAVILFTVYSIVHCLHHLSVSLVQKHT